MKKWTEVRLRYRKRGKKRKQISKHLCNGFRIKDKKSGKVSLNYIKSMIKEKQAQLGVPHSEMQVEID